MGHIEIHPEQTWVLQTCTLPTAQQPLRVAAFDDLFTEAVRAMRRLSPGLLRLELQPDPRTAGQVAQLAAAETGCCSFFTFALTATGGQRVLEVTVPQAHTGVLEALSQRVAATAGIAA